MPPPYECILDFSFKHPIFHLQKNCVFGQFFKTKFCLKECFVKTSVLKDNEQSIFNAPELKFVHVFSYLQNFSQAQFLPAKFFTSAPEVNILMAELLLQKLSKCLHKYSFHSIIDMWHHNNEMEYKYRKGKNKNTKNAF